MPLAPFLLAAFFGLLTSALLYFVLIWPSREPPDVGGDGGNGGDGIDDAPGPPEERDDLDRPAGKRARGGAAARSRRNAT